MSSMVDTWSKDLATDIETNIKGLNEFASDCLKSEDLEPLKILATLNDNADVIKDEIKDNESAEVDAAADDKNITTTDATTDDFQPEDDPYDYSSSIDKADAHDTRINSAEPIEDANVIDAMSDETATEDVPSEEIKEVAKEQILTILDLGEDEETEPDLGADYGVTIQLPEEEAESVKEENCCHGFKLVVGAIVIYSAIAFYQILATDIAQKLKEEYAEDFLADFSRHSQIAGQSGASTTPRSFYDDSFDEFRWRYPSSAHRSTSPATGTFDISAFQENVDDIDKINDVYNKTRGLLGLVSAILVVVLNYRVVILIGSIINLVVLLTSTFVRNFQVLIFLMGFCTGVGNNMLYVAMTVAILERFRKYRTMASTISGSILAIGYTIVMLLKAFVFNDVGMTTSKSFLGLLTALYGLCILAAFLVQPLNLKMVDSDDTFIARALNISGLRLFRAWGIYILAGLFFFYTYSIETPLSKIETVVESDDKMFVELTVRSGSLVSVTLIFIFMGGCCVCCRRCNCCTRKECCCRRCVNGCFNSIPINRLLIVLAIACTVASLNCLFAISLVDDLGYVFAYSTILGLATGLADPLLIVAIPALLGEEFMSLGVGVTDFAKGLATVIAGEMADLLIERSRPEVIYFMGIGTFMMGGILAMTLHRLHRFGLVVPIDSSEEDGHEKETNDDDVTEEVKGHNDQTSEGGGDALPEYCFVISEEDIKDVYATRRHSQNEAT